MNNTKLCECGCGGVAPIAVKTSKKYGHKKGVSTRFISGHNVRMYRGILSPGWKGGKHIDKKYVWIRKPEHPNAVNGYVLEHRLIMEEYLGRFLEKGETRVWDEIPHHIDEDTLHNTIKNLELCLHGRHISFHRKKKGD